MTDLITLYQSLDKRLRPEEIAVQILELLPQLTKTEQKLVREVAKNANSPSYMSNDFNRVQGMDGSLRVASTLSGINAPGGLDLLAISEFLVQFETLIGKQVGCNDFKHDRLDKAARQKAGLGSLSRRQYNKRFRLAARMEEKQKKIGLELDKREFTQVSKSRLATKVRLEDFVVDPFTACFVAYYTARCNRRSIFTNQSQDRPYDEVCNMLFQRLKNNPETCWWAVALCYPERSALKKLTQEQKGNLIGLWYDALLRIANHLRTTWDKSNINKKTMIVRRGNDSSTWNLLAGAWNKARDAWIGLLYAMDTQFILDHQCPGKVLRLMAADVASWHENTGGGLDPNTAVWNEMPLPWEVLSGDVSCTRQEVEAICVTNKLDPYTSGWVSPLSQEKVSKYVPTPDLVHGVVVSSPELARILRSSGVFSGKSVKAGEALDVEAIDQVRTAHLESQGPLAKGAKELVEEG